MATGSAGDTGSMRTRTQRSRDRGLTPLVGIVLLVGIVVLGSAIAALAGTAALGDTRKSVEVARAEGAMAEFDARVSDTALGPDGESARDIEFGHVGPDGYLHTTRDSWLRVSIIDAETGVENASVVNATLGTVTYAHGETTVAYEGGGVWRADGEGSTMVSPPEFHFRNTTLTLPVVSVDGDSELRDRLRVEQAGEMVRKYPNESVGLTNRVQESKVAVTVHSDYYLAWGRYFEETTDGVVLYDHGAQTVTVKFLSVPRWIGLGDGIVATSGQGEVKIGGNSVYIDSYNSSQGTGRYNDTQSANGSIVAANDVHSTGTADIQGEIRSGANVTLSGDTSITGTVYWTDNYEPKGAQVNGGNEQIDGVAAFEPIDGYVLNTVAELRTANDNDNESEIVDNQLTGSATLENGSYYLQDISVGPGNTLDLNTTNGDIVIAVEDDFVVEGNGGNAAAVTVSGPGTVTVFMVGDESVDFTLGKNGQVAVPDERSSQFRLYSTKEFDAEITSNQGNMLRFEGVIYAPAGTTGEGSVVIGQAEFYGAIVTGTLDIKQDANIHYDLGLGGERFPRSPTVSRLEFMHVAVHEVDVTNR